MEFSTSFLPMKFANLHGTLLKNIKMTPI